MCHQFDLISSLVSTAKFKCYDAYSLWISPTPSHVRTNKNFGLKLIEVEEFWDATITGKCKHSSFLYALLNSSIF